MRGDEMRATGALLGTALGEVADAAQGIHQALAGRLFRMLGDAAAPARLLHDGVSAIAYTSTRLGVRVLPPVIGFGAAQFVHPAAPSAHDAPRGRFALGALNGFWGDRLAEQRPVLAPVMRMRTHEGRLRRIPSNVAHDIPGAATGRVAVFVHGLCETDLSWWLGAEKTWGDASVTYGSLLRDASGWTPLYVTFNSGLHVSANGRSLAELLEGMLATWPVPVTDVALIGHSMGGLVARSAGHQAVELGHSWAGSLRHIVGLGTPHLGAPLERLVTKGTHAMARVPETRPLATWLNRRSVGIKDLRYGAVVEADWAGFDPDLCLDDRCTPASLLPGVTYSVVSATLSRKPRGPLAHDLLVQHGSAHGVGPTRRIPFEADRSFHVGRRHHFHLLGDPAVYERLREWLG
jgi:hypothetical protein